MKITPHAPHPPCNCATSNGSSKRNLAAPKKRITSTPNRNENQDPLHDGVRERELEWMHEIMKKFRVAANVEHHYHLERGLVFGKYP